MAEFVYNEIQSIPLNQPALLQDSIPSTRAIVTPAAVNEYFNFTCTSIFTIPAGCCFQVSLRNVDPDNDPTTTPAPVINIQNLNVDVTRVA